MVRISQAATPGDIEAARTLFQEYSGLVAEALCFQNFDGELEALPGDYAPPAGALLLARDPEGLAGCVALRRLDDARCEMKRMFVRERCRGSGLGRQLAVAILAEANRRGYRRMYLDTLPKLAAAIALYRS